MLAVVLWLGFGGEDGPAGDRRVARSVPHTTQHVIRSDRRARLLDACDYRRERISESMHGSHECCVPGILTQGVADLGYEHSEVDVRHERVGPQPSVDFRFYYRLRTSPIPPVRRIIGGLLYRSLGGILPGRLTANPEGEDGR